MQAFVTEKVRTFLVISSVLAAWILLAAQPAQAHDSTVRLPTPSCSNLPSEVGFLTAIPITAADPDPQDSATTQGGGVTGRGDNRFRYARITIPALAAGELRVFDGTTDGLSDAVLCGGSQPARSITSYTAHNAALAAAARADDGDPDTTTDHAARATTAGTVASTAASETDLGTARGALNTARGALNTARSNLNAAVRALQAAKATGTPDPITAAITAEQAALTAYNAAVLPSSSLADDAELSDVQTKLTAAGTALGLAGTALTAASTALDDAADAMHMGFQIRAPVSPGDSEYIVVVASQAPATDLAVDIQFHGAIDAASTAASITGALRAGAAPTYTLHISAPGLLTVETTGSTDTIGMLDGEDDVEVSQAESGGNGDNFKIVVPLLANSAATESYTLTIEGQTPTTAGDYTLDMDFKVAMALATAQETITGLAATDVEVVGGPTWAGTPVAADDTMLQIQRRAADGNQPDEDYFLLTIGDDSGFLTVEANDDNTAARDADTKGTLFGAMGEGPMMKMRTGQIATDADSGPGSHFGFTVPVEAGKQYLVKVEGTDGVYTLRGSFAAAEDHDDVPATDTIMPPTAPITDSLETSTGATQNVNRYLLSITESGTLYLRTTGTTDVTGTLYGPDGRQVARDENSGDGNNFRIAVRVGPGLYLLEVRGAARTTAGRYTLVTSFVAGAGPVDPTPDPDPDPTPVTDATGSLDDPPNGGSRSGIGLIRGWVCQATNVEVRIRGPREEGTAERVFTIVTPYGSVREQATVARCQHNSPNVGFAAQFNYNILEEGTYTATASADEQEIETNTFTVVRISDVEFLRDAQGGRVEVPNFPLNGETTMLEWDEASQNFQIVDHE